MQVGILSLLIINQRRLISMFIVFTKPNKFTKSYTEACQIAEDHYQLTGEIVAVEQSEHHGNSNPLLYLNSP